MHVVHARCCGLDVHRKTVVACVLLTEEGGRVRKHVRTFGTMTTDLLALSDWLVSLDVTQIELESTGDYWKPIFNLLEAAGRTIVLVNAQHVKAVRGRKTDVKDSEWLAGCPLGACCATGCSRRASSRPPRSASCAS